MLIEFIVHPAIFFFLCKLFIMRDENIFFLIWVSFSGHRTNRIWLEVVRLSTEISSNKREMILMLTFRLFFFLLVNVNVVYDRTNFQPEKLHEELCLLFAAFHRITYGVERDGPIWNKLFCRWSLDDDVCNVFDRRVRWMWIYWWFLTGKLAGINRRLLDAFGGWCQFAQNKRKIHGSNDAGATAAPPATAWTCCDNVSCV